MGGTENNIRIGHESMLQSWLPRRPNNSVTPQDLFEAGTEICSRNQRNCSVGEVLIIIHNVLRDNARYKAEYTLYKSDEQTRIETFNKLRDIRGDLYESGSGYGDHPGSWYRLFGMLIHVYSSGVTDEAGAAKIEKDFFFRSLQEKFIAHFAENIKPYFFFTGMGYGDADMSGKARMNSRAVDLGFKFLEILREDRLEGTPKTGVKQDEKSG